MRRINLSKSPLMHLKCAAKAHLDKVPRMVVYGPGKSVQVSTSKNRRAAMHSHWIQSQDEWMKGPLKRQRKKGRVGCKTYGDPLVFVIDFYVVSFPRDGGFGVTAWRNTLHYSWLSCCYDHVAGGLPEIVPQNCTTEGGRGFKFKFSTWFTGANKLNKEKYVLKKKGNRNTFHFSYSKQNSVGA